MIAVITADIVHSRGMLEQKGEWLERLKYIFSQLEVRQGAAGDQWDIFRGDSFQLRLEKPESALQVLMAIRAGLKAFEPFYENKMDLRAGIGIGSEQYKGVTVSESDGQAYQFSGRMLDTLKPGKSDLGLQSPWSDELDLEMQVSLPLANAIMRDWRLTAAQSVWYYLSNQPTQMQMARHFGTSQGAISQRLSRAHIFELMNLCQRFSERVQLLKES